MLKRGIVMEIKRNKAVILTRNGQFKTVRLPKGTTPQVGEFVPFAGQPETGILLTKRWLPIISTVAVVLIFIVLLGGFIPSRPDSTIAAYVSYDEKPSFTAGVNGKMQVVSVKPWNQEAEQLFTDWKSYQYMDLKEFTDQVVQKLASNGYLAGESTSLIIASSAVVQNEKKKQSHLTRTLSRTIHEVRNDQIFQSRKIKVLVKKVDSKTHQKANDVGLSMGKYLLYLKAQKNGRNLSVRSIQQMSVTEVEHDIENDSLPVSDQKDNQATNHKLSKKRLNLSNQSDSPKYRQAKVTVINFEQPSNVLIKNKKKVSAASRKQAVTTKHLNQTKGKPKKPRAKVEKQGHHGHSNHSHAFKSQERLKNKRKHNRNMTPTDHSSSKERHHHFRKHRKKHPMKRFKKKKGNHQIDNKASHSHVV